MPVEEKAVKKINVKILACLLSAVVAVAAIPSWHTALAAEGAPSSENAQEGETAAAGQQAGNGEVETGETEAGAEDPSIPEEEESADAVPGGVRFVIKGTGEELGRSEVDFDQDFTGFDDGYFLFEDSSVGESVRYQISAEGYDDASGKFTLKEKDQTVSVRLAKTKDVQEEDEENKEDEKGKTRQEAAKGGSGREGSSQKEAGEKDEKEEPEEPEKPEKEEEKEDPGPAQEKTGEKDTAPEEAKKDEDGQKGTKEDGAGKKDSSASGAGEDGAEAGKKEQEKEEAKGEGPSPADGKEEGPSPADGKEEGAKENAGTNSGSDGTVKKETVTGESGAQEKTDKEEAGQKDPASQKTGPEKKESEQKDTGRKNSPKKNETKEGQDPGENGQEGQGTGETGQDQGGTGQGAGEEGQDAGENGQDPDEGGQDPEEGEATVTGSYSNNSAKNSRYFDSDRTLLLKAEGNGFDESKITASIGVDGNTGTYTMDELRSGDVAGVHLSDSGEGGEGTYRIVFGGNGSSVEHAYTVDISYGGEGVILDGTAPYDFVIDETSPELSVRFYGGDGEEFTPAEGDTVSGYETGSVRIVLTAEDGFFDSSATKTTVSSKDSGGKSIDTYSGADGPSSGSWARNGDESTFTMDAFTEDANYTVSFEVEDLAGNRTSYTEHSFGIDAQGPEVTLKVKAGAEKTYAGYSTEHVFGAASNKEGKASVKTSDAASGVKSIKYYIYAPDETQAGPFTAIGKDALQDVDWKDMPEDGLTLKKDSQSAVYIRAEDHAGNTTYVNSEDVFIIDSAVPEVQISIPGGEKDIYDGDVSLEINAGDSVSGGTYSGLASLTVEVLKDGTVTDTFEYAPGSLPDRVREYTQAVTVDAEKNDSNNVTVKATVKDAAGNKASAEKQLSIDATAPEVSAKFTNKDIKNGHYLNETAELKVTVREVNFDPEKTSISLTVDGEEKTYSLKDLAEEKGESSRILVKGDVETQGTKTTCILQLGTGDDADIDYGSITLTCEDTVGNKWEGSPDLSGITVDKIPPVFAITYEEGGVPAPEAGTSDTAGTEAVWADVTDRVGTPKEEPFLTQKNVRLTLGVKDKNFDPEKAKAVVTSKDSTGTDNGAYPESSFSDITKGWSLDSGMNGKELPLFVNDANYVFSMEAEDLAGNRASYGEHCFGIDKQGPEVILGITVDGEEEKTYTEYAPENVFGIVSDEEILAKATASDAISAVQSLQYYIHVPETSQSGEFDALTDEELLEVEWKDVTEDGLTLKKDSQSVIYIKAADSVGNITYVNTKDGVIVDSEDPKVKISVPGGEKDVYGGDIELEIDAKDVLSGDTYSGLVSMTVEILKDGAVTDTLEYTPGELRDRVKKYSHAVTVKAKDNDSNNVTVRATVEDAAGNTASSEKHFSIDTAAPEVSAEITNSGIKNGHYLNETAELEVTIRERNFDPASAFLFVHVDGEERSFNLQDLSSGKGSGSQILVKGKSDSQEGNAKKDLTDNRKVTFTVQLGTAADADIDYGSIRVTCQDAAGNRAEGIPSLSNITVDKVPPVYAVTYKEGGKDVTSRVGTAEDTPYYTQKSITVTLGVRDRNFNPKKAKVSVTAKDYRGNDSGAYPKSNYEDTADGWNSEGDVNRKTLPVFEDDSNYGISLEAEDLAGNRAQDYPSHYFTVDKTAPSGKITVHSADGDRSYSGYSSTSEFKSYSRETITVTRSASDRTSGVASVKYHRYVPPVDAAGTFSGLSLEELRKAGWEDWEGEIYIKPDSQAVIYARIADRAGNILYLSTEGAMIADKAEPWAPDIKITTAEPSGGVYGGNVPASVSVGDPVSGGTYAGLKKVSVEVMNGGNVTQQYSFHPGEKRDRVRTFSTNVTVDAKKNNSNSVTIRVTAEDNAGNVASAEKQLAIDITDPVIEVTYDRNDPVNGRYYNVTRTATIVVKERNFDPSRVNISVPSGAKVGSWKTGSGAGTSDNNQNTCTIVYDTDGDYTFTMSVTDKAGNKSEYGHTDSFTIDKTKPVISVTYNVHRDGKYYNASRTATIHVTEKNFRAREFEARIRASLEGSGITAPSISEWSDHGDDHTATIVFDRDGEYSFTLDYTDLASNNAYSFTQKPFVIDLTAPEVAVTGVVDKSANRGEVAPVIRYTDLNYDDKSVSIKLKGHNHGERDITGKFVSLPGGGQITMDDFVHSISEDDVYTLTVRVADKAGNVTEKTIEFSINRFGSNIYLDESTAADVQAYYLQHAGDIIVYEVNVDEVVEREFTVYRDGRVASVPESLIRIKEIPGGNGWKKYRYVIDKSAVDEEGHYEVIISTTDKAGNKQENRTKDAPVSFVIDRTAPLAAITGIEDGEIYNSANREFTVICSDNRALAKVELMLDGKVVETYEGSRLEEMEGKIPYTLERSGNWQSVSAAAYDAAGNVSDADAVKVLVTTDLMTRVLNSGLFKALMALPFAAAMVIAILATLKKKKDEEDDDEDYY